MKVSIITINYNNALGLKETIKSIVSKNLTDIEYLVIDGSSTDESVDIIKKNEDKISLWVSEPDSGIYNAMNKGIIKATGEYVLFINSGDTFRKDADMQEVLKKITGEDIVYFNMEVVDPDKNISYIKKYPDKLDFKYFAEDTLPHHASFIKRDLLIKYNLYSEQFKIVSDWAFFMDSVCLNQCSYKHIDDCFSSFYLGGISSFPSNWQLLLEERNKHISTVYPLLDTLYHSWADQKTELYKLKTSVSVRTLKKLGFLRWLKM